MQYQETQHLKLNWLFIIIAMEVIIVGTLLLYTYEQNAIALPDLIIGLLGGIGLPAVLVTLIMKSRFRLNIDEQGFTFSYFPFILKTKTISWSEIDKAYFRNYDAMGEYGGYGVRRGLWFKMSEKAYILNQDNRGLQLELKKNQKVLFSSNELQRLEQFLIQLKSKYSLEQIQV